MRVVNVYFFFQLSFTARKWPDCGENSSTVFQRKVYSSAEVPAPSLSASGAGAETYLPATRSNVFRLLTNILLLIILLECFMAYTLLHTLTFILYIELFLNFILYF